MNLQFVDYELKHRKPFGRMILRNFVRLQCKACKLDDEEHVCVYVMRKEK